MSTFCGQRCGPLSTTIGRPQVTDSADVWTQVTLSLRSQLAESVWFSTFQDVSPLPSDGDTLRLLAPSGYVRDRIMSRYGDSPEGMVELRTSASRSALPFSSSSRSSDGARSK